MQTLNLGWFARMALALQPLSAKGLEDPAVAMQNINGAWGYLVNLGNEDLLALSLDASRQLVWGIMEEVGKIFDADEEDRPAVIAARKERIYEYATRLNVVLEEDLAHQTVFNVLPKRAYSTRILIFDAVRMLAENVRPLIDAQERYNIEQAGKCLAFEVPTAAVFHLVRAVESVIRRYYAQVVGTLPKPKMRNWGVYIQTLRDCGADPKITGALEQMKDMYRNPVIHPETQVELEDALSFVSLADNVIGAMLSDIERRKTEAIVNQIDYVAPEQPSEKPLRKPRRTRQRQASERSL